MGAVGTGTTQITVGQGCAGDNSRAELPWVRLWGRLWDRGCVPTAFCPQAAAERGEEPGAATGVGRRGHDTGAG